MRVTILTVGQKMVNYWGMKAESRNYRHNEAFHKKNGFKVKRLLIKVYDSYINWNINFMPLYLDH